MKVSKLGLLKVGIYLTTSVRLISITLGFFCGGLPLQAAPKILAKVLPKLTLMYPHVLKSYMS
jgi:hypothetical protein